MVTVAWALVAFLAFALLVVARMWWITERECSRKDIVIRHLVERNESYRVELDALSIAGPPPVAAAALTPDDPSLLPAEVEQWLRERTQ